MTTVTKFPTRVLSSTGWNRASSVMAQDGTSAVTTSTNPISVGNFNFRIPVNQVICSIAVTVRGRRANNNIIEEVTLSTSAGIAITGMPAIVVNNTTRIYYFNDLSLFAPMGMITNAIINSSLNISYRKTSGAGKIFVNSISVSIEYIDVRLLRSTDSNNWGVPSIYKNSNNDDVPTVVYNNKVYTFSNNTVYSSDLDGQNPVLIKSWNYTWPYIPVCVNMYIISDVIYGRLRVDHGANKALILDFVFSVGIDGSNYTILKQLSPTSDGWGGNMVVGDDNKLYIYVPLTYNISYTNYTWTQKIYTIELDGTNFGLLLTISNLPYGGSGEIRFLAATGGKLYYIAGRAGTGIVGNFSGGATLFSVSMANTNLTALYKWYFLYSDASDSKQSNPYFERCYVSGTTVYGIELITSIDENNVDYNGVDYLFTMTLEGLSHTRLKRFTNICDDTNTPPDVDLFGFYPKMLVLDNNKIYGVCSEGGNKSVCEGFRFRGGYGSVFSYNLTTSEFKFLLMPGAIKYVSPFLTIQVNIKTIFVASGSLYAFSTEPLAPYLAHQIGSDSVLLRIPNI